MSSIGVSGLILMLLIFTLHIGMMVWAYKDAVRRGKGHGFALVILLLVLFLPILGFIIYLLIRKI